MIKFKKARTGVTILILVDGFLQCIYDSILSDSDISHNPYFSRWFSAICTSACSLGTIAKVTILILVDGFLQWEYVSAYILQKKGSQSLF